MKLIVIDLVIQQKHSFLTGSKSITKFKGLSFALMVMHHWCEIRSLESSWLLGQQTKSTKALATTKQLHTRCGASIVLPLENLNQEGRTEESSCSAMWMWAIPTDRLSPDVSWPTTNEPKHCQSKLWKFIMTTLNKSNAMQTSAITFLGRMKLRWLENTEFDFKGRSC